MPNTVNIALQEFAFVDSANPASRITGQATQQIVFTRDTAMLMHFQRIDPSLKFRPIISVKPHFYVVSHKGYPSSDAFAFSNQAFDPSTVNYYSKPEQDGEPAPGGDSADKIPPGTTRRRGASLSRPKKQAPKALLF